MGEDMIHKAEHDDYHSFTTLLVQERDGWHGWI